MSGLAEAVTAFSKLRVTRSRVALATLVAVHGPAATLPGARMWLTADGHLGGAVTLGGCADAHILEVMRAVLGGVPATRITASLGEDEAYGFGMSCSGSVDVFVEVVDFSNPIDPTIWAALQDAFQADRRAVLITQLTADGAQWVVSDDGATVGSAKPHTVPSQRTSPGHTNPPVQLLPRGDYDVLVEVLSPRPRLVIVGAGPVAAGLTILAHTLGYRSTVVDARAELLTPERFPAADDLRLGIPDEAFDFVGCDAATAVVLTAHNYAYEVPVLRGVLRSEAGYIGLVAGRRRGQAIMAFLEQTGVDPEQLRRVQARAGLDIGALTPTEIALSIFAEILAHREGKLGLPLIHPEAARSETRSAFARA